MSKPKSNDNNAQKYDHIQIEHNWRDHWFNNNLYKAEDFSPKPKKYILAELPYPSGEFLHCGHMMRYTVPEIYSRYLRMKGYNVLYPMGWDCFGLPGETFAIKKGITPQEAIKLAVTNFKASLKIMGYAIDWDREVNTSDPEFYKWTQWMFLKLWEKGLAQKKEMPVWWCEELGVLADEEVLPDGNGGKKSERGGYPVKKVMFKQWILKITDYADRLLEGLDSTEYTEPVKQGQINWIGKKTGAEVNWQVGNELLTTFTTRPDTIFGVTFLALAPEHPVVEKLLETATNKEEVEEYIRKTQSLSELERQTKEKTGVQIKGVFARHPFAEVEREIPIFLADYILLDFGTGVVQGVPAHDERDFEFATKYNLEILPVIETTDDLPYEGHGTLTNSGQYTGQNSEKFLNTAIERLEQEGNGKSAKTYKLRDQIFSRQRYWGEPLPLMYKENGDIVAVSIEDLPVELPVMEDFLPSSDGTSPLARNTAWNQVEKNGETLTRETDTMPTWAGSNWYYIRYLDPHNSQEFASMDKMKYWLPVDKYFGDAGHTTAHLMYTRFWIKALYDQGYMPIEEPIKYRMSGGMLLGTDGKKMSKSKGNTVDPKEVVDTYGADATRMYLAFIGPYESTYPWNFNGIQAIYKLLKSIHGLAGRVHQIEANETTLKALHKAVKNMTEMFEDMRLNTAVSEVMILTNHLKTLQSIPETVWKDFIKLFAPFAPYLAEELWQKLNHTRDWQNENSVHLQSWPTYDEKYTKEDVVSMPVQINGKHRATLEVPAGYTQEQITEAAKASEALSKYLDGVEIKKIIFVRDKIVNFLI